MEPFAGENYDWVRLREIVSFMTALAEIKQQTYIYLLVTYLVHVSPTTPPREYP